MEAPAFGKNQGETIKFDTARNRGTEMKKNFTKETYLQGTHVHESRISGQRQNDKRIRQVVERQESESKIV